MGVLHDKLAKSIPNLRKERQQLLDQHGDATISDVSVRQVVGGMRDVRALVCDTSVVDPDKGLLIRGTPVSHLAERLPEEVFFLLLTGDPPDGDELADLRSELAARQPVDDALWRMLEAMPAESHPMTMLIAGLLGLEHRSIFKQRFAGGMKKSAYWEAALEDSLGIIAVIPELVAGIYRMKYDKGTRIAPDPKQDWAADMARMMGKDDEKFCRYLRLATVVQSDHEGGHASALTAHTVGSVLSSAYHGVAAGWGALAGPLHGLSSEVCIRWVLGAMEKFGGVPSDDQIRDYTRETIESGRVVPGYGHAVLRGQDPRYLAILAFGEKNTARDPVFKTVVAMSRVVPSILMEQGKVKNPWPNVDAINGALFHHFGVKETEFYTVFFAAALALGFTAQYTLNRALGTPITRPRSVTTKWIKSQFEK